MALAALRQQIIEHAHWLETQGRVAEAEEILGALTGGRRAPHPGGSLQPVAGNEAAFRPWYVLQCEPVREMRACAHLTARGVKVYLPLISRQRSCGTRTAFGVRHWKRRVTVPMFPGYLFARLDFAVDDRALRFIRITPGIRSGVHSFLRINDHPVVVPESAMLLVQRVEEEGLHPKQPAATFRKDQHVKVTEGPFAGFQAVVAEILRLDPEERIRVLVDIFGRATPVDLQADQLAPLL